jgi:hypothetical protein
MNEADPVKVMVGSQDLAANHDMTQIVEVIEDLTLTVVAVHILVSSRAELTGPQYLHFGVSSFRFSHSGSYSQLVVLGHSAVLAVWVGYWLGSIFLDKLVPNASVCGGRDLGAFGKQFWSMWPFRRVHLGRPGA